MSILDTYYGEGKSIRDKITELEQENKKLKADIEHTIKFNNKIIGKLKLENDKLKVIIKNNDLEQKADWKHIEELEQENKKLKESLDIATKCSSKEEDGIIRLSEENKKLKSDLSLVIKERDDNIKRVEELEKEIEELNKMMLFETELEK